MGYLYVGLANTPEHAAWLRAFLDRGSPSTPASPQGDVGALAPGSTPLEHTLMWALLIAPLGGARGDSPIICLWEQLFFKTWG